MMGVKIRFYMMSGIEERRDMYQEAGLEHQPLAWQSGKNTPNTGKQPWGLLLKLKDSDINGQNCITYLL